MSDLMKELAVFPPSDLDRWRADVEKTLKGKAFDEALVRSTPEGLPLAPLYTRADRPSDCESDVPGAAPFGRGLPAPGTASEPRRGWLRCVDVAHPDARQANAMLLTDLEGGAERATIRVVAPRVALAASAEALRDDLTTGTGGTWIAEASDLDTLLTDVRWSLAPIAVIAPPDRATTDLLFAACTHLRQRGGEGVGVQIDLLRTMIGAPRDGEWLQDLAPALGAEVRRVGSGTHPADARPLWMAAGALRLAGADMVQEIAAALGLFVAAVRALEPSGIDAARALRATEFRLAAGNDFFGEIAKARAFRRCLALVLDTLGITDHAGDTWITVATAEETLARRDAHVNLLRVTAQATAAVLGGADGVVAQPFDARDGETPLGRRMARNLHALLDEECEIAAVTDPAGGSFYLEARTEALAAAAWAQFVAWERAGGFVSAWRQGLVRAAIDERWQARAQRLRTRREPVLGVSVFPRTDEKVPDASRGDVDRFLQGWRDRLGDLAATADGPADQLLAVRHVGDDFEALRDRSDALAATSGSPPIVRAALVGAPGASAARLDWVRDLLAAAGIRLEAHEVNEDAADLPPALVADGTTAAVVIAPDALHGTAVPAVVSRLRQAGLATIVVAGRPGEHERALREAGVSHFVYVGADVVPLLADLLAAAEDAHARA